MGRAHKSVPVRIALPSGHKSVEISPFLVSGEVEGLGAAWSRTVGRPAVFWAGVPFRLSSQLHPCHRPRAVPRVEKRTDRQVGRHLSP